MYKQEPVKIFIVEDDPAYTKFLQYVLSLNPDFEVSTFSTGKDCLDNLYQKPTIITLDYTLPDMSGEKVLSEIKAFDNIQVIIISAQEKIGTAVELLKLGAYDYITKDEDTKNRLLNTINNARQNISLIKQIDYLKQEISEKYEFDKSIVGSSGALKKVFALLEKAVKTNITVSITGETGTGKELVAKAIHYNSKRKKKPFVAVNIAAIPSELMESELFGHEKGAFTGANTRRIGKFEEAEGGTIFLDEIGEMDLNLQAKLLRVIQERELTRIGGNEIIKLDIRLIVATHRDLAEEVKVGNFREDLYYRLLGLPVHLPPLRDRGNDIVILAKHFLQAFAKENDLPTLRLSAEAQEKLLSYPFPGNVRELKSIMELAAVMANDDEIKADDISFNSVSKETNFLFEEMTLRDYTFKIIRYYLDKYDNNVLQVADKLDIGKSTIYRYLKEMEDEPVK
ncbi:sigma-54-dependent Fis family transcriptional regulator [Fulvivirga sp. 29W222]|uniref:Sigma-54-dependent Fis family transcriptional regulator n=1 Tax=Fulvivirga marina TaxID=2494733 RepID=A0A937KEC9_9BACT|nr:sigma-54 dependent transcriptional regulator [Fulvivirga marina]MBL6449986.1 sigma-54-dependent Fis family transcriptional regulator [Fulvivirga marina]